MSSPQISPFFASPKQNVTHGQCERAFRGDVNLHRPETYWKVTSVHNCSLIFLIISGEIRFLKGLILEVIDVFVSYQSFFIGRFLAWQQRSFCQPQKAVTYQIIEAPAKKTFDSKTPLLLPLNHCGLLLSSSP